MDLGQAEEMKYQGQKIRWLSALVEQQQEALGKAHTRRSLYKKKKHYFIVLRPDWTNDRRSIQSDA